jgi:hypothetical protein
VEESVSQIWTLDKGPYHDNNAYRNKVYKGAATSGMLAIAVPRDGGNVLSSEHLTEIKDRLTTTQQIEF